MFSICDIILFRFYAHTVKEIWYNAHMAEFRFHDRFVLVFLHSMNEAKLAGVYDFATKHGWHVQTFVGDRRAAEYVQLVRDWRPVGCIVDGQLRRGSVFPPRIKGVHAVQLGNSFPTPPLRHAVTLDNRAIARAAADILAQKRPDAFGFVPASGNPVWSAARGRFLADALRRGRHKFFVAKMPSGGGELEACARFLEEIPKPAGVMLACDGVAPSVFKAARDLGLRIPEDLSIVSVDNDQQVCCNLSPTLTSIEPDFASGGYLAGEMLMKVVSDAASGGCRSVYGIATVAFRQSTLAAYSDRRVENTVGWIAKHATSGADAMDVVRVMGCSRRHAEHVVRRMTGKSIGEAIADARFDAVLGHLRGGRRRLEFIASSCGFSSAAYLAASFKRRYGMSTRQWCRANCSDKPGA